MRWFSKWKAIVRERQEGLMKKKYNLVSLSDKELTDGLNSKVKEDHGITAELVAHIAEYDARQLYLRKACSSMFAYCTDRLFMTRDEAYRRIHAARAARRHPEIFVLLAQGEIQLSGVTLLAPRLTAESGGELIAAAKNKSKREIELLLATLFPQPDLPATVRKLPTPKPGLSEAPSEERGEEESTDSRPAPKSVQEHSVPWPLPKPAVIAPLAPARFKVQFTAGQELHDKLEEARALLRHQIPDGDIATIFDRALSQLLADVKKKKLAATSKPRAKAAPSTDNDNDNGTELTANIVSGSRHIPADVKRRVVARDGLSCTFTDESGRRCNETGFLEFHHLEPYAKDGAPTVDNIAIYCRLCRARHNLHYADSRIMPRRSRRPALRTCFLTNNAA
jgi:5-methylcytosine-specific restriction endonuclease McrA